MTIARRLLLTFSFALSLLLASLAHADTLLLCGNPATDYNNGCWINNSTTISGGSWKASRYQAKATGTIAYFQIRVPSTPTGCTNDSGCWAIYEAGTNSVPGALKAYNCFSGYDWTVTGAGVHSFNVVTTVTNLTVTSGQYYWLVWWSWATDATNYASAGCSSQILAYRGDDAAGCLTAVLIDDSSGYVSQTEITTTVSSPPAPSAFDLGTQTYMLWGVWASTVAISTPELVSGSITGMTLR